jgi:preprotein translocase subunit SecA
MPAFFDRILRAGEGRILKDLSKLVVLVNAQEPRMVAMSDDELREQTQLFKNRFAQGETLDQLLPEAFAVVREHLDNVTMTFNLWVAQHFTVETSPKCAPVKVKLLSQLFLHISTPLLVVEFTSLQSMITWPSAIANGWAASIVS